MPLTSRLASGGVQVLDRKRPQALAFRDASITLAQQPLRTFLRVAESSGHQYFLRSLATLTKCSQGHWFSGTAHYSRDGDSGRDEGDDMKSLVLVLALTLVVQGSAVAATSVDTSAVDRNIGRSGQLMDGGVYRVSFPRTDLSVMVGNVKILPGLALGGYAAFVPASNGTLAVGDLVLLEDEIQPVMESLKRSGFEITALHNHLRGERPHVMYMHFMASGDAGTIASNLRSALARSKTPLGPLALSAAAPLSFKTAIEQGLGRSGRVSGRILSVSFPRAESIMMDGMAIPPAAGVATAMNFQDAGNGEVATTGDFVLLASEVGPVQQELLSHGIEVTALHQHMLDDSPHLYYMHFWAVQRADQLADGLKAALAHMNLKR